MPLQKPPPYGTQPPDTHSIQRRQLQERRRTLQTISELSVTDGPPHDFSTHVKSEQTGRVSYTSSPIVKSNSPHLSKRRSLPQYCECRGVQPSTTRQLVHTSPSPQSPPKQAIHTTDRSRYQNGWNAKREKARVHREQEVLGVRDQRDASSHKLRIGNQPSLPNTNSLPLDRWSRDQLGSYSSHHQLRHNSRLFSRLPQTVERRSSLGGTAGSFGNRDYETESSERASTDSSSYRSTHESVVRRSRSGSSNHSATLQEAPSMPNTIVPSTQRYYSKPANFRKGLALGQPASSTRVRRTSTPRSSSLPLIWAEDVSGTHHKSRRSMPPSCQTTNQEEHRASVHTARLAALAALTASNHDAAKARRMSRPSASNLQSRLSTPAARPRRSDQIRTQSNSSLGVPKPHSMTSVTHVQNPDQHNLLPESMPLNKRFVPRRESLTQWKAEREESDGMRRVHMKERVRRANELEQQREKELMLMGKGTGTEKKESGCWSGLSAMLGLKGRRAG